MPKSIWAAQTVLCGCEKKTREPKNGGMWTDPGRVRERYGERM